MGQRFCFRVHMILYTVVKKPNTPPPTALGYYSIQATQDNFDILLGVPKMEKTSSKLEHPRQVDFKGYLKMQ